jgi:hypothetical protein
MKGNIQHEVVQLIDKYGVSDVLDVIMELGSDSLVHEMRMWFEKNLTGSPGAGEELDEDVIQALFHDLQHVNMRLVKIEKAVFPQPTEPVRLPEDDVKEITKHTINNAVKKLGDLERTIPPHMRKGQEK